jgi:hypothetical protein
MNPLALLADAGIIVATAENDGTASSWYDFPIPLPIHKSSCIASATWALRTAELTINFHSGAQVAYPNIDVPTVIGLCKAESPGSWYNSTLRGH